MISICDVESYLIPPIIPELSLNARQASCIRFSVWQPWILLEKAVIALNVSVFGNPSNSDVLRNLCGTASTAFQQNYSSPETAIGLQLEAESKAVSFGF